MRLDQYKMGDYSPGANIWKRTLWYLFGDPIIRSSWLFSSVLKIWVLRLFGAAVGNNVKIKPGVRIKFPWRLLIGDHSWIGEEAWIDNLAPVKIGAHCCISQAVYLCTGNHNWSRSSFDLITKPIVINDHVWIAARANVGPGVTVGEGAILSLGSTATEDLRPWSVYQGNPAVIKGKRIINN